jgi:hypothetical protein
MPENSEHAPVKEERLRAAIGPRADYYLRHWRAMDQKGKFYDWNWPACLLNVFWFAYRKMWGPMVAMGLAFVVATPLMTPDNKNQLRIVMLTLVALSFVTGTFGNWLYRRQTESLVARTAGSDAAAAKAELQRKGGVSVVAAIVAVVAITLLSMAAGMIPALLAHRG